MGCVHGRIGRTFINVGSGYDLVEGVVDATLNGNIDEHDCTSKDSDGNREWIVGHMDWAADYTIRYDPDASTQLDLFETLFPSPEAFLQYFIVENVAGRQRFEADSFLTSYSISVPLDDVVQLDTSMRFSNMVAGVVV